MPTPEEMREAIAKNVVDGIKRQRVGTEETEAFSPTEQADALNSLGANEQVRSKYKAIFNKLSPPGAA